MQGVPRASRGAGATLVLAQIIAEAKAIMREFRDLRGMLSAVEAGIPELSAPSERSIFCRPKFSEI